MRLRFLAMLFIAVSFGSSAEDESVAIDTYSYYGLEPEIVTNYITTGKDLGYIRVTVELMVKDPNNLALLEYHAPLIRSTIIEILGEQTSDKIKSLPGRESIRRECYDNITRLLEAETGKEIVTNLLFTKYLYN